MQNFRCCGAKGTVVGEENLDSQITILALTRANQSMLRAQESNRKF